jgi:hypothetical protein
MQATLKSQGSAGATTMQSDIILFVYPVIMFANVLYSYVGVHVITFFRTATASANTEKSTHGSVMNVTATAIPSFRKAKSAKEKVARHLP